MRIDIPQTLYKYQDVINKNAKTLVGAPGLTVKKIGQKKDKKKITELYVMYNPYMNDIHLDINSFAPGKNIYSLSPSEIKIPYRGIQAFVIECIEEGPLELDPNTLIYETKLSIEENVRRLTNRYDLNHEFNKPAPRIEQVKEPEFSETVALTQNLDSTEKEYVNYTPGAKPYVRLDLIHFKSVSNKYELKCKLSNTDDRYHYIINNVLFRVIEGDNEVEVNMHQVVKVKSKTYKELIIKIDKEKFEDFNVGKAKIKIKMN